MKKLKKEFYKNMNTKNGGFVGDGVEATVDNIWDFIEKALKQREAGVREEIKEKTMWDFLNEPKFKASVKAKTAAQFMAGGYNQARSDILKSLNQNTK